MDAIMETMSKYYFSGDFLEFAPLFSGGEYRTRLKRYRAGEVISSQGETLNNGYYIVSGTMQLKIGSEVGKERTLAFFGPGSVFPLGINEHHYRIEYAMVEMAFTDVVAYQFVFSELRRMALDVPDLALRMIEHYCDFTSYLFFEQSASYRGALSRVAGALRSLDERMAGDGKVPLTQSQIAEVVGISKVQVARAYQTLVADGAIEVLRGCVRVLDREVLARYEGMFEVEL